MTFFRSRSHRPLAVAALLAANALLTGCASDDQGAPTRTAAVRHRAPQPFLAPGEAPAPATPPGALAPAPVSPPKPPPALAMEDATRLQIFLDRENFGPGKLDGKLGEFTRKALVRYGRARNKTLPPPGPALMAALPEVPRISPFTDYTLSADDMAEVGTMSEDRVAQGKQKSLPYTSALELLGERFHSEQDFLRRLNPGQNLGALAAGSRVRVPDVSDPLYVNKLAGHGHLIAARPEFRPRVLMVYTKEKMVDLLEDGQLLASFPITPGSTTLPAPPGTWKIENMASMPYFRYDESMLEHGVRSNNFVNLPPGPNSPVGVMWMGLNKSGIGLHGTNNPETIGRAASHGCIRLANWDAVKLSQMVTTGVTVHIDGEGKPPAPAPATTKTAADAALPPAPAKPVGETGETAPGSTPPQN